MQRPNTPENEVERVAALHELHILDTTPEERFDRLTRLAKRLFNVPIALVSLVDTNRQWFKSCVGTDASETSRDISFCGHTILGTELFVIPDALEDERFADNPLVTESPNIRFYAGCPISSIEGYKLGTLCIIDTKPRHFTEDDLESLKDLSALVEREIKALQLATTDDLTLLHNRRDFIALSTQALLICQRQKQTACLLFFDLNDFKQLNDSHGHAEGDKALQAFSQALKDTFRQSDICSRLGGDEFVVLLTDTDYKNAYDSIERLQNSINQLNDTQAKNYKLSFSSGLYFFEKSELSIPIKQLLEHADRLMYIDKAKHKKKK